MVFIFDCVTLQTERHKWVYVSLNVSSLCLVSPPSSSQFLWFHFFSRILIKTIRFRFFCGAPFIVFLSDYCWNPAFIGILIRTQKENNENVKEAAQQRRIWVGPYLVALKREADFIQKQPQRCTLCALCVFGPFMYNFRG